MDFLSINRDVTIGNAHNMVVGLFGHPGAHVLSHAEKENGSENEHVIVQNHCLVGTIVKVPIPTNRHVNCRWFVQLMELGLHGLTGGDVMDHHVEKGNIEDPAVVLNLWPSMAGDRVVVSDQKPESVSMTKTVLELMIRSGVSGMIGLHAQPHVLV